MAKCLIIGDKARQDAVSALSTIAQAIGSTLGPAGLPAILDKASIYGDLFPVVSKDGLTLLSNLDFVDPVHKLP